jgi:hypothetical protein
MGGRSITTEFKHTAVLNLFSWRIVGWPMSDQIS